MTSIANKRSSISQGVYRVTWSGLGHSGFTFYMREREQDETWGPWRRAIWFGTMHDFRSWADHPGGLGRSDLFNATVEKLRALYKADTEASGD